MKKRLLTSIIALASVITLASCADTTTDPITGPTGPAGQNGQNGADGLNGVDGATWLFGSSDPSADLGAIGDLYLNTDTYDIYAKTESGWTLIGNIKGEDGLPGTDGDDGSDGLDGVDGTDGKDGATWLVGSTDPEDTIGEVGDLYLNDVTGDIFTKDESNNWRYIGNLKGDKGDTGEKGDDGLTAYSNTILPSENGYVLPSIGSALAGQAVSFTLIADEGYSPSSLVVNNIDVTDNIVYADGVYSYEATMVEGGFIVQATFALNTTETNVYLDGVLYQSITYDALGNLIALGDPVESSTIFDGGTGTEDDPLIITTVDQLEAIDTTSDTAVYFRLDADLSIESALSFGTRSETRLDLNGNTLSVTTDLASNFTTGDNYIANGTLVMDGTTGVNTSIYVANGASLTIDSVVASSPTCFAYVNESASSLNIIDSEISATVYGVSTNAASESHYDVNINIENSTITTASESHDNTAVLINIPSTVSITGSTISGERQSLIVRGGDVTVTDSTIRYAGGYFGTAGANDHYTGIWGSGNEVPTSAIVLGDYSPTAYRYDATLTLGNVTFEDLTTGETTPYQIYLNQDTDYKATLNLDYDTYDLFDISRIYKGSNSVINIVDAKHGETSFINGLSLTCVYDDKEIGILSELTPDTTMFSFDGGSGTEEDPLTISDTTQLSYIDDSALALTGAEYFALSGDIDVSENLDFSTSSTVNLDLNQHTLDFAIDASSNYSTVVSNSNVTISNGIINYDLADSTALDAAGSFTVQDNGSLTFEGVIGTSQYRTFVYMGGQNTTLNINSSHLTAAAFAVGTNAGTSENYYVDINIFDSDITSTQAAGILMNVPGTLDIEKSHITGESQGLLIRSGTTNIVESTIELTNNEDSSWQDTYLDTTTAWGSGNSAPKAGITIGDVWKNPTTTSAAYYGDKVLNLTNVTFLPPVSAENKYVGIYANVPENNYDGLQVIINTDAVTDASCSPLLYGNCIYTVG